MGVLSGSRTDRDEDLPQGEGPAEERQIRWRAGRLAQLSSGIAHEVRNPLNAMAIHLEVLTDKLRDSPEGGVPEHLKSNLEAIRKQIWRLDELVRTFADFAQGRSDQRELEPILRSALDLCAFPQRRLGLEVQVGPIPQVRLATDCASISLALLEVLLLGVESSEPGGGIHIDASVRGGVVELRFAANSRSAAADPARLAMVEELLASQAGWLHVEDGERGVYATVALPLASHGSASL